MKRKGKKTFRGTELEHRGDAVNAKAKTLTAAARTYDYASRGDCKTAIGTLMTSLESLGKYNTHMESANLTPDVDVAVEVGRGSHKFQNMCLRPNKKKK